MHELREEGAGVTRFWITGSVVKTPGCPDSGYARRRDVTTRLPSKVWRPEPDCLPVGDEPRRWPLAASG
jgi:hypothetical protein